MAPSKGSGEKLEFSETDDGRIAAHHRETGIASYGDTEEEAVRQLRDTLKELPGGGCAELWEYMSEYRDEDDEE